MFQIKFTGTAEIPFALNRDKNYTIAGDFEEVSRTEKDVKDGSVQTTFSVMPLRLAVLDEAGNKVRLKTKNSNSTRIRAGVFRGQKERRDFVDMEPEEFYDTFTDRLLVPDNLQAVFELLNL